MRKAVSVLSLAALLLTACNGGSGPATRTSARTRHRAVPVGSSPSGGSSSAPPGLESVLAATRSGPREVWLLGLHACAARVRGCAELYRSGDAGRSWTRLSAPATRITAATLTFTDERHGWLLAYIPGQLSDDALYATDDGGRSWQRVPQLHSVGAITVSAGRLYATADDGAGRAVYAGSPDGTAFQRMAVSTGDSLLAQGTTVYDYDAQPKPSGSTELVQIADRASVVRTLPCGRDGFTVGLAATTDSRLMVECGGEPGTGEQRKRGYVSDDGGMTWRRTGDPGAAGYVGIGAVGSAGAFFTGDRMSLYASRDGGRTWTIAVSGDGDGFTGLFFTDPAHGMLVRVGGDGAVYLTDDGGAHWRRATLPA